MPRGNETDLLIEAARRAGTYLERRRERGVFPSDEALANLSRFPSELPDDPRPPADVLELLDRVGSPATVCSTGGRYFGFVTGGTDPAARAAAVLAGAWDQNLALPVMSPVGAHLDEIAARWCVELLGLPASAVAAFCSGASIANLTAILTARDTLLERAGWNVATDGLWGAPPLRVVATAEIHASVTKALRAAGFGQAQIEWVPTDGCGRLQAEARPELDDRTLVLLQAGNVNTGHSDPFDEIIPAARAAGSWVHVDGAFGLWAQASPAQHPQLAGVEGADSWATDAHKWLNAPYDSGIVICRHPEDLRRSMTSEAAYLANPTARANVSLGLQMSQRARGIEVWSLLAAQGRSGVADLVDRLCARAEQMGRLLREGGVEVLVPVALNQVLARFDDDLTTAAVMAAVQQDRTCWAGGTVWQGKQAMRISICDLTTTEDDVRVVAAAILRCWREESQHR